MSCTLPPDILSCSTCCANGMVAVLKIECQYSLCNFIRKLRECSACSNTLQEYMLKHTTRMRVQSLNENACSESLRERVFRYTLRMRVQICSYEDMKWWVHNGKHVCCKYKLFICWLNLVHITYCKIYVYTILHHAVTETNTSNNYAHMNTWNIYIFPFWIAHNK